jgi:phage-related minor tail protein
MHDSHDNAAAMLTGSTAGLHSFTAELSAAAEIVLQHSYDRLNWCRDAADSVHW